MEQKDVKVGMRVVPHGKSIYGGFFQLKTFEQWKERYAHKSFSIVEQFHDLGKKKIFVIDGNWFLASDFEPYLDAPEPKKIPFTIIMPL